MRKLAWIVVAALTAGTLGRLAIALSNGREPWWAAALDHAGLIAVLVGFLLSIAAIARPDRVVALFVPLFALYMLAGDFTYDPYYAPDLQRYWDAAGDHTKIVVGVVLAFVIGGGSYRSPRSAGAVNLIALPVTFVLTIAYVGH